MFKYSIMILNVIQSIEIIILFNKCNTVFLFILDFYTDECFNNVNVNKILRTNLWYSISGCNIRICPKYMKGDQ